jgi:hypothetical protein
MRAQILAQSTVPDFRPASLKTFGWRASRSIRRWKLFGAGTAVLVPATASILVGLV